MGGSGASVIANTIRESEARSQTQEAISFHCAPVAQLEEQDPSKVEVTGSTPVRSTIRLACIIEAFSSHTPLLLLLPLQGESQDRVPFVFVSQVE